MLDGVDLTRLTLADLRREVMLVDQSPYLFNASIAENIAFARPDANRAAIEAAARAAGLDGERGLAVSAGERQRIALARALLRRPSVLILDEPTSALDERTEQVVALGLRAALPESTLIVITHRSALAAIADATITIEDAQAQMVRQKNSCVNSGPGNLPSE